MKNEIKAKLLLLVNRYCRENKIENIPECIKFLIVQYLLSYLKITLFNFRYLSDSSSSDKFDWEGYLSRSKLTSILAGITIQFNSICFDITINFGAKLSIFISLKNSTFNTNMDNHPQTLKSMTGSIWKFPKSKSLTALVLMSRSTTCACYNREGNQVQIYLLTEQTATKSIFAYYSDIWTRYPIPLELRNKKT